MWYSAPQNSYLPSITFPLYWETEPIVFTLSYLTSDEIAASTGYIGNESTAQGNEKHHCDDCLLQNEQHKTLAAMESHSLKTKAQQVKVTQVVSANASRVYSCTETVQPKEYQVLKS